MEPVSSSDEYMRFILGDSELELISDFLKRNNIEEKVSDDILEKGKDEFLERSKEASRAGRPDIAYVFHVILSNYLSSGIEYGIHTRNNKYIDWVELNGAETYSEFKKAVIKKLKSSENIRLKDLINKYKRPVILSQFGIYKEINYIKDKDLIIIGGFPTGDYISEDLKAERISIDLNELTVPSVLIKILKTF